MLDGAAVETPSLEVLERWHELAMNASVRANLKRLDERMWTVPYGVMPSVPGTV